MSEQIKTTTVDQLPEATSLDGLYVFGYASKNAVGKRSVKAPITLLKGNTGAKGEAGKDGKDGEITTEQLAVALRDSKYLATATENGLMSIEQFNFIEDMATNMQGLINAVKGQDYKVRFEFKFQPDYNVALGIINTFASSTLSAGQNVDALVKLKTSNVELKTQATTSLSVGVPLTTADENYSVLFSDAVSLNRLGEQRLDYLFISSVNASTTHLNLNSTTSKKTMIRGFTKLKHFEAKWSNHPSINLMESEVLETVVADVNATLESIQFKSSKLKSIDLSNCPKLTQILTYYTGAFPDLTFLNLSHSSLLSESTLMTFTDKWNRTGLSVGTLKVHKTLYDALVASGNIDKLINKNINVQGHE